MNWKIQNRKKAKIIEDIEKILLEDRGLRTKEEIEDFLNPSLQDITPQKVGIDSKELGKAVARIKKAIDGKEKIAVYGDYDVDGICGTAILWETLNSLGADVMPYIPHRVDEGYGLSEAGISNAKSQMPNLKLIITVDNGIVAVKGAKFAKKRGIDVIITDHHAIGKKSLDAFAIVHTTKLCGAGVAFLLSQEISNITRSASSGQISNKIRNTKYEIPSTHLELVAFATVADLVPLTGANRTLLEHGLKALNETQRIGILALLKETQIEKGKIDTYEIGHVLAPRLNATGRIEHAMESLRLICTRDPKRAATLAKHLSETNLERRGLTDDARVHAVSEVLAAEGQNGKIIIAGHETYQPGVIGLVAGRLVEEFYRPSIVLSLGEKTSKASARSIEGFNMIEFLRSASEFLEDVGGHPMAAGFTIKTERILEFKARLMVIAEETLDADILSQSLRINCELPMELVSPALLELINKFSPFGMGNPAPTFVTKGVDVSEWRFVGQENKHLKLRLRHPKLGAIDAIGFGMGNRAQNIRTGDKIDIVYTIFEEEWNGRKRLQLKFKDLVLSELAK